MAEDKKSKGKGCLIALAVVGVLIVVISIGVLYFANKAKDVIEDFAEGKVVTTEIVEEIKSLNDKYPFTEPESNLISERQINQFIAIKRNFSDKIKSHEDTLKLLEEKSEKEEYGFKEMAALFKLVGEIRRDFLDALQENEMSPREYGYLAEQIYNTYLAAALSTGNQQMPEENIKLLNKYKNELEELNTSGFEFWGLTLTSVE